MKIYLDLLPEQRKQEIRRKKLFVNILREEFLFLFPLIMFILILVNIYYVLRMEKSSLIDAHAQVQAQEEYLQLNIFEEKFKQTNSINQQLSKIQTGHLRWYNLFRELSGIVPEGISISDLSTRDYSVFIAGKAKTRDELLDFKNKIEAAACFQEINMPLSNLVVKDDVDFQIDFKITENCLKNK